MINIPRNPHLNRAMIRDPKSFFGRGKELVRLASRISADPPQSTALIGDRRIGKSSLLYHVSHKDVAENYLPDPERTLFLFMDFQQEQRLGVDEFFYRLFRRLETALEGKYKIPETSDYESFRSIIEDLDRDGFRLILLLDEFDRVTHSANFQPDFFGYLRSLAGHHNIAYITSSSRNLQQLCHTQEIADSPFFNIFSTVELGPLSPEDAVSLIRDPSSDSPFPLADHVELILELSGFLPFFLQIACSSTFEILVEEGACNRKLVCERFLEEAQPHFQYYWDHFDPVDRAICNDLACGRSADTSRTEYQDLLRRGFVLDENLLFSTAFSGFVKETYAREMGIEPVEVQAERLRSMERELEEARAMQMALLPQEKPEAEGLDIAGRCVPASQVSGDFYHDIFAVPFSSSAVTESN